MGRASANKRDRRAAASKSSTSKSPSSKSNPDGQPDPLAAPVNVFRGFDRAEQVASALHGWQRQIAALAQAQFTNGDADDDVIPRPAGEEGEPITYGEKKTQLLKLQEALIAATPARVLDDVRMLADLQERAQREQARQQLAALVEMQDGKPATAPVPAGEKNPTPDEAEGVPEKPVHVGDPHELDHAAPRPEPQRPPSNHGRRQREEEERRRAKRKASAKAREAGKKS